jgi:hypothetical protein
MLGGGGGSVCSGRIVFVSHLKQPHVRGGTRDLERDSAIRA